jgi:phosphopantothenoylcysteine decarboxylase / phosphopantothenate---cysteine ligase
MEEVRRGLVSYWEVSEAEAGLTRCHGRFALTGVPLSAMDPVPVVLGVGGGIAAYKAAELARALIERGCTVETVMTSAAQEFIQPLTFAALTGRKVITSMFGARTADEVLASSVEHIAVAQRNRLLVVAPATAHLLAQFAHGLAGDFLSTLYLAFQGPSWSAPP